MARWKLIFTISVFLKSLIITGSQCISQTDSLQLQHVWEDITLSDSARFTAFATYYNAYIFSNPHSCIIVTKKHYDLAKQLQNPKEMAEALNKKALAFYILSDADQSLTALGEASSILSSIGDAAGLARIQSNIGNIYRQLDNYQEAIHIYVQSLFILNELDTLPESRADMLNNIGLIYQDVQMYPLALEYLEKARNLYASIGLEEEVGNIWLNTGAVYLAMGNTETALLNYYKALPILKRKNNMLSSADCMYELSHTYNILNKQDSALYYISLCLDISESLGNEERIISSSLLYAALIAGSNPQEAMALGEDIYRKIDGIPRLELRASTVRLLYESYKALGRPADALFMLERYQQYSDSLQLAEDQIGIIRQAIQSEFDQKLFVTQLENEKAQATLRLKQERRIYFILLVTLLLLITGSVYIRLRSQKHRRQRDLLLAEIEQLKWNATASVTSSDAFLLNRQYIEAQLKRKLNETDWKVLNVLLVNPVISNKDLSEEVHLSIDGIGSSLRRMYAIFEVPESRYKKIALLMQAVKLSGKPAS